MKTLLIAAALLLVPGSIHAQVTTPGDSAAIRQAALDYIEGWYEGDAERMERALHPELAKRIVSRGPDGRARLDHMSASQLTGATRNGGGKRTPASEQRTDVRILDVFRGAASVRVDAHGWIDYMHLARGDDGWVIVNVLWELRGDPAR